MKTSNIDLSNTKIEVTPEQSVKVQEYAFSKGWDWLGCGKCVSYANRPHLYFLKGGTIMYGTDKEAFTKEPQKLITYSDIFPDKETETKETINIPNPSMIVISWEDWKEYQMLKAEKK